MSGSKSSLEGLPHDLTENALEFLQRAVRQMKASPATVRQLSFAVVDLAVAVEVLLKARLVREHWTLICDNPDKATAAAMLRGTLKTVSPDKAMSRLQHVAAVPLTDDHSRRVTDVGALRNRVVHFAAVDLEVAALQSSLARCLDFVLWLLATEFREKSDERVEELVEEVIDELTTEVGELEDLVKERLVSIASTLDAAVLCVECPRCRQAAVTIGNGLAECAFCLWKPLDGREGAGEYAEIVLDHSFSALVEGFDPPIYPCLWCGTPAMVKGIEQLRPDPQALKKITPACDWQPPAHYACFECGYSASDIEVMECRVCETLNTDGEVCGDCLGDIMSDRD